MVAESAADAAARQLLLVCASSAVTPTAPTSATVGGLGIVLFRGQNGRVCAFLNRCPHRGRPLADGSVVDGILTCRYHGWAFNDEGRCIRIPGLRVVGSGCDVPTIAMVERDGLVLMDPGKQASKDSIG
jgi:vanillate O-demethylase monooxygenase subunit